MAPQFKRVLSSLDLEERILNGAALLGAVCVFLPWLTGEWLGEDLISFTGFGSFTSVIGFLIFALLVCTLGLTLVPAFGGPQLVRRRNKEVVRLCLTGQATVLSLAALSVLTKMTYDFPRMEIRFGIYCTFICSLVATFYAFWRLQEQRKNEVHEVFHHPDASATVEDHGEPTNLPPPPPPPPPLEPEDYRTHP